MQFIKKKRKKKFKNEKRIVREVRIYRNRRKQVIRGGKRLKEVDILNKDNGNEMNNVRDGLHREENTKTKEEQELRYKEIERREIFRFRNTELTNEILNLLQDSRLKIELKRGE